MYIPTWLVILIIVIIFFFIIKSKRQSGHSNLQSKSSATIEDYENAIKHLKDSIFSLEHFDSPHFIDYQDTFDVMEENYFRLKQRFSSDPKKVLEIAKDWHRYVQSLHELKSSRVLVDVDMDEGAWDRANERDKEPSIIRDEVEKKFKSLLGNDWQKLPPNFFERMDKIKDEWKHYYSDSPNMHKWEEMRQKAKEEKK